MSFVVQCVIAITVIVLLVLSNIFVRYTISKLVINLYLIFWLIILLVSTTNPFGLYDVSFSTYMLLLLGVVMFSFGYFFTGLFEKKGQQKQDILKINELLFETKTFKVLVIFFLVVLLYFALKYLNIVKGNVVSNISTVKYGVGVLFESGNVVYFYDLFVCSFVVASTYIFAYMIFFWRKKNYFLLLLVLAIPVLNSIIGATRGGFMDLIIALVFFYFIKLRVERNSGREQLENKEILSNSSILHKQKFLQISRKYSSSYFKVKKMKKGTKQIWVIGIVCILFVSISIMTSIRENGGFIGADVNIFSGIESTIHSIVIYLVGPFRAFEYGLALFPKYVGWGYGQATFAAVFNLLNVLLKIVRLDPLEIVNYALIFQDTAVSIGINDTHFNFAYTYLMAFYLDFWIFGIILLPFLYGCLVRAALNRFRSNPNIYSFILIGTLFQTTLLSVFSWRLQFNYTVIVIIICFILSGRKNKRVNNNN